jgi:hypothetical protein
MKKIQNLLSVAVLVAVCLTGVVVSTVSAAVSSTGNGMRVSPVKDDTLVIQPGSSKTVSVFISNVTGKTTTYSVIKNDFVASSDETGAPALLLNGEVNDKHGLKKYITTIDTITVKPGKQGEVKVTIAIPKGAAGGGYYGAIRFVPGGQSKDNNIALTGSVASLLLVRVPGDVIEKLSLVSFDVRADNEQKVLFTSNKGIKATVRFRNEGNIQEQPFGKITLRKGDKVLAVYEINNNKIPGPANVLPDSIRKFDVELKKVGSFGKYTVEGSFGYGSDGHLLTAKTSFYVIPIWLIALAIALVIFVVGLGVTVRRKLRKTRRR